jgi:hypothetical protein
MYRGKARCIQDLVGRPQGRRPLGRPSRRWDDNIKMDLQEVGWGMDWTILNCPNICLDDFKYSRDTSFERSSDMEEIIYICSYVYRLGAGMSQFV